MKRNHIILFNIILATTLVFGLSNCVNSNTRTPQEYSQNNSLDSEVETSENEENYCDNIDSEKPEINNESFSNPQLREVEFRNEQDVFIYLNGHKFASDDGLVLSFRNSGRYMYGNDKILSTNIQVVEYRPNAALIIANNIYGGRNTFMVHLEDYAHFITDVNDGTYYDEQ